MSKLIRGQQSHHHRCQDQERTERRRLGVTQVWLTRYPPHNQKQEVWPSGRWDTWARSHLFTHSHIVNHSCCSNFLFLFKNFYLFHSFLAVLGLHWCMWDFSSCREQGILSSLGLPSSSGAQASPCGGFSCCRLQALGTQASVAVAHGFSCSIACGTFPDQGLNLCSLHWQEDS